MSCCENKAPCVSPSETLHLFGSWGDPTLTDARPPEPTQRIKTTWQRQSDGPRPWLVRTSGRGRQRRLTSGSALQPLNRAQLETNADSFGLRPVSRIQIEARTDDVGGMVHQPIIMDAGGSCIVYAQTVSVSILTAPSMAQVVPGGTYAGVAVRDMAIDELISGEVAELKPIGQTTWVYSQTVQTVNGQRTSFPIPANARDLTITPQTSGTPGVWRWAVGDFQALGAAFQLGAFTPTNRPTVVPSATHLEAAAAAGPETFTLAWTIQA